MRWLVLVGFLAACSFEHGEPASVFADAATTGNTIDAPPAPTDGSMATTDAPPSSTISCPGVACGAVCCVGACAGGTCAGEVYRCDGPEDCGANEVCCNDGNGSTCTANCYGEERTEACNTAADCNSYCNDCSFDSDFGQKVCCGD